MRGTNAIVARDQAGGHEGGAARLRTSPSQAILDARTHGAIDLLTALIAHAEAARRRLAAAGEGGSRAVGLTRWLVASALRIGEQLKDLGLQGVGGPRLLRSRAALRPLRSGADQLVRHMRARDQSEPSVQDVAQIAAIVRRLEALMDVGRREARLPDFLAARPCAA